MQLADGPNVVHRDLKPANFLRSEPFPDLTRVPALAALCSVKTAASVVTFGSRTVKMALDRRPWGAMKPVQREEHEGIPW
jgi:hypothetical protein